MIEECAQNNFLTKKVVKLVDLIDIETVSIFGLFWGVVLNTEK